MRRFHMAGRRGATAWMVAAGMTVVVMTLGESRAAGGQQCRQGRGNQELFMEKLRGSDLIRPVGLICALPLAAITAGRACRSILARPKAILR